MKKKNKKLNGRISKCVYKGICGRSIDIQDAR